VHKRAAFEQADAVVREALGVRFTAAQLRVERFGRAMFERAYGFTDASRTSPTYGTTRFDLASLTKPFVACAALREVATGRLSLDGSLLGILPEWRGDAHEPISLRMILAHVSGMQSGADYRTLFNENVERYALSRPLVAEPRERVIYSDLGFIVLGTILERTTGRSLSSLIADMSNEMDARTLGYRRQAWEIAQIPATEDDARRGRVRGYVHDEKADFMGGVAGHAGLFGSALDIALLTEAFLGPLHGRSTTLLPAALVRESLVKQAEDELLGRGLGWMLKKRDDNSCGALMRPGTFGHTGFTGTCVWADPSRDAQVVFLTNAVYFGRSDLRELRATVCDAAIAELDAC
jgi:CubicO group peptidase (beta-lactamase class C family)